MGRCPRCGGLDVVPIGYGYPGPRMFEASRRGEIRLGGCMPLPFDRHCRTCGREWMEVVVESVEVEFASAVQDAVRACKRLGYRPSYFLQMLDEHGPIETARRLATAPTPTDGFTRLWELRRLDLTVEALMLQPRFESLFSDNERRAANDRLEGYGYRSRSFIDSADEDDKDS